VRLWLARAALVLGGFVAGVALLALVEAGLRVAGVGAGAPRHDPFAGFANVVQTFEPIVRADGTRIYHLVPARRPQSLVPSAEEPEREFPVTKAPGTFRVFVIGASSAAGVPYGTRYAFGAWLARRLEAALPSIRVEVVNAGIPSYGTRRELTIVREIAGYEPDLLIVYSGHNEFVERQYYAHLLGHDPRVVRLLIGLARTRLYALVSRLLPQAAFRAPQLDVARVHDAREIFAVVSADPEGKSYPTDRERAYAEMLYRENLEQIVETMRGVGARVVLGTLSQNFGDWAPAASMHRDALDPERRRAWDAAVAEGDRLAAGGHDCTRALDSYHAALAIDDRYADLVYRIATCERRLGRFEEARTHYREA